MGEWGVERHRLLHHIGYCFEQRAGVRPCFFGLSYSLRGQIFPGTYLFVAVLLLLAPKKNKKSGGLGKALLYSSLLAASFIGNGADGLAYQLDSVASLVWWEGLWGQKAFLARNPGV
jgi:hypothetical protein